MINILLYTLFIDSFISYQITLTMLCDNVCLKIFDGKEIKQINTFSSVNFIPGKKQNPINKNLTSDFSWKNPIIILVYN